MGLLKFQIPQREVLSLHFQFYIMVKAVSGFSKLKKSQKIEWLLDHYFHGDHSLKEVLESYWNSSNKLQQLHDEFIENTISNFYLPLGIAPNFLINGKIHTIPM